MDLAGFVDVVDTAGGIDVDVPGPVRDPGSGLLGTAAGRQQHVDGTTALAIVRSRHPEHRVGGRWVPAAVDPDEGASAAGAVLAAVTEAGRGAVLDPWRLQRIGWAVSGALGTDGATSLVDLGALAGTEVGDVPVLPVGEPVGGTLARFPTEATRHTLAAAGLSCRA